MGQNKLIMRALEPEDLDSIYRWENDPEVWSYSDIHTPFSKHALTQYLINASSGDFFSDRQLRMVAEVDGNAVGCVDLFDYDPANHRAGIGMLVDASHRQQGIGGEMVEWMTDYGLHQLQLHQIYCHVAVDNSAALALFNKAGYQQCGILRDWQYCPKPKQYKNVVMLQKVD